MEITDLSEIIFSESEDRISSSKISNFYYQFRPEQFHRGAGFLFNVEGKNQSTLFSIITEDLAGDTLSHIKNSDQGCHLSFHNHLIDLEKLGILNIEIGYSKIMNDVEEIMSANWHHLLLELETEIDFNAEKEEFLLFVKNTIIKLNSTIMSYFELEYGGIEGELGLPEGAKKTVTVNKYERSKKNREACIAEFGSNCQVCGFSFGATYGKLGEGCIHVHHLVPVSKMGGEYRINPIEDLIPVCPNCHWMLHRKEPPYTPQELREIMAGIEESSV